jgi:hypothetical protein
MNTFGFIIIRHVNSENTNKYWNHSVKLLRIYYPNKKIIIIDDNSNQNFVKSDFEYKNIEVIQSEFHGRGELLPYYYYIKKNFFDNAVIIHDSVFFHTRVNFELLNGINVIPLWFFIKDKDNIDNTLRISNYLNNNHNINKNLNNNNNVINFITNDEWYGCFGVQSYINHNFLLFIESKYNISNMIKHVKCRADRCCLERIFGSIFFIENPKIIKIKSLFGNILSKKQNWGYSFDEYMRDLKKGIIKNRVVKVWTGR